MVCQHDTCFSLITRLPNTQRWHHGTVGFGQQAALRSLDRALPHPTREHQQRLDHACIRTLSACLPALQALASMQNCNPAISALQFGPGVMQQHGFARNLDWEINATSADPNPDEKDPCLELSLTESEYTTKMWSHKFKVCV